MRLCPNPTEAKPAFPEAKKFASLFPNKPSQNDLGGKIWNSKHLSMKTGKTRNCKARISSWITVDNVETGERDNFYCVPALGVIEWIKANMVHVKYDTIYFTIIIGKGFCSVRAQYNQIIGSCLLAEIDPASIPTV